MDAAQEPYEIAGELSQKQLRIMESIRTRGDKAKTSKITDDRAVSSRGTIVYSSYALLSGTDDSLP